VLDVDVVFRIQTIDRIILINWSENYNLSNCDFGIHLF